MVVKTFHYSIFPNGCLFLDNILVCLTFFLGSHIWFKGISNGYQLVSLQSFTIY